MVNNVLSDVLKIYNKEGKFLVLNPLVPSWIVTNINGVLILKQLSESKTFEETAIVFSERSSKIDKQQVLAYLDKVKDAGLLELEISEKIHKPYTLSTIYFNMTKLCNLHCLYCFAATRVEHGSDNLEYEDYIKLLDFAHKINPHMTIVYTGGEPLMSPNTIKVAKYAKKLGFTNRILTNATLIDKHNIEELADTFDLFKISVDGSTKEKHEYYRGTGSYDKTIHAIDLLRKKNKKITVAMVVTRANVSDVLPMNAKWGEVLEYQPLFPLGRAAETNESIALTGEEYYNALSAGEKINPFADLGNIIDSHKKSNTIIKCAIGDGEISISCTGDLYPCQLLHNQECLIGNIKETSFLELYNSKAMDRFKFNTVGKIDKCKKCDIKYLCGGACQARHYSETGSINETGDFCEYEKKGIIDGLLSNAKMIQI